MRNLQMTTAGGDRVTVTPEVGRVNLAGLILLPHEAERLVDLLQKGAALADMAASRALYAAKYEAKGA